MTTHIAADGELFEREDAGQRWRASWHPPAALPEGRPHGSAAVCLTSGNEVVLISEDGEAWGLPGGRPEGDEDWRATLDREVLEEACARVEAARLLGFARSECTEGRQRGTVLVRSFWRAEVTLLPWAPQHEIVAIRLVPPEEALGHLGEPEWHPIYRRIFLEAGIT